MVKELKENEFKDVIKNGKVLIDCYATWCGPCRMLSPIIDELSKEIEGVDFYKLDVDDAPNVSQEFGIMSIPTLLLFKDGKLSDTVVGLRSKEDLEEFLK